MQKMTCVLALALLMSTGLASAADQNNRGELTASEGVKERFEDPDLEQLIAGMQIKCVRHRRVGTHMIKKTCMTVDEWTIRKRETRENQQDNYSIGGCVPSSAPVGGEYMNSDAFGALVPTGCGDRLNRGN